MNKRLSVFSLDNAAKRPGVDKYVCRVADRLWFIIWFQLVGDRDAYHVELAASTDGMLPDTTYMRIPSLQQQELPFRFRVNRLWEDFKLGRAFELDPRPLHSSGVMRFDTGWQEKPIDDLLPAIDPFVDDTFDKLEQYGIRYFYEAARIAGVDWSPIRKREVDS